MKWRVEFTNAAYKQRKILPKKFQPQLDFLAKELELLGPIRKNWRSFGVLHKSKNTPILAFHCHIKRGRPTYVVCWRIVSKTKKIIEVYYVGTHEKAPY